MKPTLRIAVNGRLVIVECPLWSFVAMHGLEHPDQIASKHVPVDAVRFVEVSLLAADGSTLVRRDFTAEDFTPPACVEEPRPRPIFSGRKP